MLTKKELKEAVGCRITVRFLDQRTLTGIYLGKYRLLTASRYQGQLKVRRFFSCGQVINIDESSRRPLLDMIFSSPAETDAKAELNKLHNWPRKMPC